MSERELHPLKALAAELERQNADLQEANNRLLTRAREAERERDQALTDSHDRVAELTDELNALRAQRAREREAAAAASRAPKRASETIGYGEPIRKVGGAHEVDGFLAGVVTWAGVEHPVMAIPVARGFLLHIYAWAQLARRALVR